MPIYMNYDNKTVKGDVTAKGWEDWIELNSFQWGVGRGIASPTGGHEDREVLGAERQRNHRNQGSGRVHGLDPDGGVSRERREGRHRLRENR